MLSQSNFDMCLIGPKGCGKSITVQRLSELLSYEVEPIILYQVSVFNDIFKFFMLRINDLLKVKIPLIIYINLKRISFLKTTCTNSKKN